MKSARLARDWVFVVGTPVGVLYMIGRQLALGALLIAFFWLVAFMVHRAAEVAQRGIQAEGRPTGRGATALLLWGQVLIILNVPWLALFQAVAALWLLVATLPPGIMAIVAWYQLRRTNDARVSG